MFPFLVALKNGIGVAKPFHELGTRFSFLLEYCGQLFTL